MLFTRSTSCMALRFRQATNLSVSSATTPSPICCMTYVLPRTVILSYEVHVSCARYSDAMTVSIMVGVTWSALAVVVWCRSSHKAGSRKSALHTHTLTSFTFARSASSRGDKPLASEALLGVSCLSPPGDHQCTFRDHHNCYDE